jgi:recombination protein RecR
MSMPATESLAQLIEALRRLPGIGPRSAERIGFHLLMASREEAMSLAQAIQRVKDQIRPCSICYNLTEQDPCAMCTDPRRDSSLIVVVEQPKDVVAIEATGLLRGRYHVLMGHIAPLEGTEPGDLTIDALLARVRRERPKEVVLATNPTVEGDGTAMHLHSLLSAEGVRVTRLARGLAVGSQLEYASPAMLQAAIVGRSSM